MRKMPPSTAPSPARARSSRPASRPERARRCRPAGRAARRPSDGVSPSFLPSLPARRAACDFVPETTRVHQQHDRACRLSDGGASPRSPRCSEALGGMISPCARTLPSGTVVPLHRCRGLDGAARRARRRMRPLAEHRRIVREACASGNGAEVDTQGGAFFLAFPTAPAAVQAAPCYHGGRRRGPNSTSNGPPTPRRS